MGSTSLVYLNKMGLLFFAYAMKRMKNSKFFRDIREKWVKDNYNDKTLLIFEAAIVDSKAVFQFPDKVIKELLDDKINREEVFRWILEGTPIGMFDSQYLNLEPYIERYPEYQDFMSPFFEMINVQLHSYKEIHWEPEFLQIINSIRNLEDGIKEGFEEIKTQQQQTMQLSVENNYLLKAALGPVGSEDLNDLIKEGRVIEARQKAEERLKRSPLQTVDLLELNAVIASTYMNSGQEEEAIPYLHVAITYCGDEARKKRLKAIVDLYQNKLESALTNIQDAIQMEGKTVRNVEILANIYLKQNMLECAIQVIDDCEERELSNLKGYVLLAQKKFEEIIELAEQNLQDDSSNINWLLLKIEALLARMENDFSNKQTLDTDFVVKEAMPLIGKIEENYIENTAVLKRLKEFKAALYFRNMQFSEAKLYYEELYRENNDEKNIYFKNFLGCCLCDHDFEKAIHLLEEVINVDEPNKDYVTDLAKVYVDSGRPQDAISLLEGKKSLFNTDQELPLNYYFPYIDALFLTLQYDRVKQLITVTEKETTDNNGVSALKAYYFSQLHEWEKVIEYWEECIESLDGDVLIEGEMQLSLAFLNRGNQEDLIKLKALITSIPNWKYHDALINRYVRALYQLGEYQQIIALGEELPQNNIFLLDVITTIYLNSGWYEIAKDNLNTLYLKTKELTYLLRFANCLFRLGDDQGCLSILESAEKRVRKNGSIEDFNLLSIAYMSAMQYRKSLEFAYETYISGKDHPNTWRFYLSQMSQLGRFVDDPEDEWGIQYRYIIDNFHMKFPDEDPLLKQIKGIEEDGQLAVDLINILRESNEATTELLNSYTDKKLPMSFLVTNLRKEPFQTWLYVKENTKMSIWGLPGNDEELVNGLIVARESKAILCDITTLYTIRYLGLLDILKEKYEPYIHQDDVDSVFQEYLDAKLTSEEGIKMMGYENGQLSMREYSPEQVKWTLDEQEEFLKWIHANCKKVGNVIEDKTNEKNPIDFINKPIEVCKQKKLSLLEDSFMIVGYAKDGFGVKGFTTYDFLRALHTEGSISSSEFMEANTKLILMGYSLIPVKHDVIVYNLEKHVFKLNKEVLDLLDYLKREEFSVHYLIDLVATLLGWIWIEPILEEDRRKITDYLCYVLTHKRNKRSLISVLLRHSKSKFSPLVMHQWEKMDDYIQQWIKSQAIL